MGAAELHCLPHERTGRDGTASARMAVLVSANLVKKGLIPIHHKIESFLVDPHKTVGQFIF